MPTAVAAICTAHAAAVAGCHGRECVFVCVHGCATAGPYLISLGLVRSTTSLVLS